MKKKTSYILIFISILLFALLQRIYIWELEQPQYKDENGITYPLDLDSYAYLHEIRINSGNSLFFNDAAYSLFGMRGVFYLQFVFFAIFLLFIYKISLLFYGNKMGLAVSAIIALSDTVLQRTYLGVVDHDTIALLWLAMAVYLILCAVKASSNKAKKKTTFSYIAIFSLTSLYFLYPLLVVQLSNFSSSLKDAVPLVQELHSVFQLGIWKELLIMLFALIVGATAIRKRNNAFAFLYFISLSLFAFGLAYSRFIYLAFPFIYVILGDFINGFCKGKETNAVLICLMLPTCFFFLFSFNANESGIHPQIDDSFVLAARIANESGKNCIVNFWDYGNVWLYYTSKDVPIHSHPYNVKAQYDFFTNGTLGPHPFSGECLIIFLDQDYPKLEYIGKMYGKNLSRDRYWIANMIREMPYLDSEKGKIWILPNSSINNRQDIQQN